ncbi:phage terminase small subunit, partial [Salmonella enterica subsp. enterica serovar Newport]
MQLSPAQRHSARIAAERLLRQQQSLDSETSLHVQIAALEKDVEAAAAISNRAERMEFKRDVLLPRWMPTAQTWLESDSMHQNPVFAWCVIWLFDTGQFDQALDWADAATLMAGAIQQVSAGDFSQAVKGNRLASITGNE